MDEKKVINMSKGEEEFPYEIFARIEEEVEGIDGGFSEVTSLDAGCLNVGQIDGQKETRQ